MNAVLSIELEVLQPVRITSASELQELHPSQIRWVSIRLTADGVDSVPFLAQADDARAAIRNLIALAQRSQPEGTAVLIWYQGRSEGFVI